MTARSKYRPINCSFYDLLEADATMRATSNITYATDGSEGKSKGVIQKLFAKHGEEWLELDNGLILRLDQILTFNGNRLSDAEFC